MIATFTILFAVLGGLLGAENRWAGLALGAATGLIVGIGIKSFQTGADDEHDDHILDHLDSVDRRNEKKKR